MDILMLATYPPRFCGIATYTFNLVHHLKNLSPLQIGILAINDSKSKEIHTYSEEVQWVMDESSPSSYLETAKFINSSPSKLIHIQHEFGIFGGRRSFSILTLVESLTKPYIVTFHSTPPEPEDWEEKILKVLYEHSEKVVVQSRIAQRIVTENYGFSPRKISYIPHGIPKIKSEDSEALKREVGWKGKEILLTFGFLSPRKGIDTVLKALSLLKEELPNLYYVVLGRPHPRWEKIQRENFIEYLMKKAKELRVDSRLMIKPEFLKEEEMLRYIQAADIIITPYPQMAMKQVVSGVLVYSMGCRKAIISTPYLHAQELLSHERGVLIEFDNPWAVAENVRKILRNPHFKRKLEERAYGFSHSFVWPQVARKYLQLYQRVSQVKL